MALCASGEMSLAGDTVGRSVNREIRCASNCPICMNQAEVRTLAGRPDAGSAICMCDFYNKGFFQYGCAFCGGYYMALSPNVAPHSYYIILAPNATGCACCQWKTTLTSSANTSNGVDGYANTYNGLNSAIHPAGNWTATRSINGYSDWYLPSSQEIQDISRNRCSPVPGLGGDWPACLPADQNFFGAFWSSTQSNVSNFNTFQCDRALQVNIFEPGPNASQLFQFKTDTRHIRAVRREPFSDIRLKTNIKFIGTIDTINIYEYNYLWEPTRHKGVMAQELLGTKYSDSVIEDESGFYRVDYSKLPDRFQEFILH